MSSAVCVSASLLAAVDNTNRFVRTLGLFCALVLGVPMRGVALAEVTPAENLHAHTKLQINNIYLLNDNKTSGQCIHTLMI